jgi:hypothetical protein
MVSGSSVVSSAMAHMVSLARAVAVSGACAAWPDRTFVFTMSRSAVLRVHAASLEKSVRPETTRAARSMENLSAAPVAHAEEPVDPRAACGAIHEALAALPRYGSPEEVPFSNGLYFFFEAGEENAHGQPRITRIGNHPRVQHRLVGRLQDHYKTVRDAKNGSVFRRYLGGALLRRDGREPCLQPAPGHGHWEHGNLHECDQYAAYETRVTERLRSSFSFTCVEVKDQVLRNRLERRLIASVAQCSTCRPSEGWLGLDAYPGRVRTSGLWNSDHVDGPGADDGDLASFLALVRAPGAEQDLADTLLLLPCCKAKRGTGFRDITPRLINNFLGRQGLELLLEGRSVAFARARLDTSSEHVPAIARYSGQPFLTAGVLPGVIAAMDRGLHVVIVSGGYGLVRAEEPIQDYEAPMQRTLTVWRSRIPEILRDYVSRNSITRTFGARNSTPWWSLIS